MQGTKLERQAALVGDVHNKAFICSLLKSLQILRLLRLFRPHSLGLERVREMQQSSMVCFAI